jgi:signal transduction histidine kinase
VDVLVRHRRSATVALIALGVLPIWWPYRKVHELWSSGIYPSPLPGTAMAVIYVAPSVMFMAAGIIAWRRRPTARTGPLMYLIGLLWTVDILSWPGASGRYYEWLGWLALVSDQVCYGLVALLLFWYPDDAPMTRVQRTLVVLVFVDAAIAETLVLHTHGTIFTTVLYGDAFFRVALFSAIMFAAVHRYVKATGPARRMLAPILFAGIAGLVPVAFQFLALPFAYTISIAWVVIAIDLVFLAVPVAFLFGLLRERLDHVAISRLAVDLQRPMSPEQVRSALSRALGDPTLDIAYWIPDRGAYVDSAGAAISLNGQGRIASAVGEDNPPTLMLVHDRALVNEPDLLEAAGATARLALENARLQAELQVQLAEIRASRSRIVEAADEERRRLERDLHDGAQQRLLAIGLALQLARTNLPTASVDADVLLAEAEYELGAALDDLRDLAHGIHPAILTDAGLAPALRDLAARCPIPVEVRYPASDRLPPAVESAGYFVVSESLANVVKHARANRAEVSVDLREGCAVIVVSDNGTGGAAAERGTGLRGLADRINALNGTLDVHSPQGHGTQITASLPCAL